MKKLVKVGLLLLVVMFALSSSIGFTAPKVIKVGIVNLPPDNPATVRPMLKP
jgi:uncharacterized protein YneF (UPF0154 family)